MLPALGAGALHRGRGFATTPVVQAITCDLMSDVLAQDRDDPLLVTSLGTLQAVRTADIVAVVSIVLVNGKSPSEAVLRLAKKVDISLVGSSAAHVPRLRRPRGSSTRGEPGRRRITLAAR